jgi:RHH-type proline utilization regulon transcriptional repressor/proline dehydrogenase/delta 1-pyrroline-5-carboxylate dehydrogenase
MPDPVLDEAIALARRLQARASELQTADERRQQAEFDRMIQHPEDKATLVEMTDQAFRSKTARRSAEQLTHILDVQGIPQFFSPLDRTLLRGFRSFGGYLPGVAMPLVREKMREETANVVLPAEPEHLGSHLRDRKAQGVRMNVNFLGEALLGEGEAERRLEEYLAALDNPDIEVVSVKISTIYSQISHVARETTIERLCDRFELLVRAAASREFVREDGSRAQKLVYLDMEEYRDLGITVETFRRTLDRPGLEGARAGIALQAYVPDSFAVQRELTQWARDRVSRGGAPITLRIVKGANLEMERVESSLHGWPQAPFDSKRETDANYKRMVEFALRPENAPCVRVGVASHNLFELAYARVLSVARGVEAFVHFEMLEGMANHQRRALFEETGNLLLYAPACRKEGFINAIGYLVRRLDENTGEENFLRHAFNLEVGSAEWLQLEEAFRDSFSAIEEITDEPRRTQDRSSAPLRPEPAASWRVFVNEPDTDFSLSQNVGWLDSILEEWDSRTAAAPLEIPLVVAGAERQGDGPTGSSMDPSRPGHVVARFAIGSAEDVDDAVACAVADPDSWRSRSAPERTEILRNAAHEFRRRRGELIGIALAEGGKLPGESDVEISEAIDFCEFYASCGEEFYALPEAVGSARGVVAVIPPWNFPIAIPCGGVAAALAAGNTVVLKPAPETVATGWAVAECFWRAGVPKTALQFLFAPNEEGATRLATHPDVDTVVFTGGTATALSLLSRHPEMRMLAETGGKNATIVTALADRDLAVKSVVQSAFGHAGQKCSATSLLILEREVYEEAGFRAALCDATESLKVGSAWDLSTAVGPLIREPAGVLAKALKELGPGESWLLRPRRADANRQLWSPGIKWGVSPGSFSHVTEFFGPLLGVMVADGLDEAIELVHQTGYGLTSGLQSLDDREQELWASRLRAGNLYVNRGTTGAIVLRQPFGGVAKSAIGPGIKAGGPNYVAALMRFADPASSEVIPAEEPASDGLDELLERLETSGQIDRPDRSKLSSALRSYRTAMRDEFGRSHDHFSLVGQDNIRRYRPIDCLRVRVHEEDASFYVLASLFAAFVAGTRIILSVPPNGHHSLVDALAQSVPDNLSLSIAAESDDTLCGRISGASRERLRFATAAQVPAPIREASAREGVFLLTDPPLAAGRLELLNLFQEQSLCIDYHRYGNLGRRAGNARGEQPA